MNVALWVVIGCLCIVCLFLTAKVFLMRKSAEKIAKEFEARLTEETNVLLDIPSRDRKMRELTAKLNRELAALREERHRFQQGDSELKEAVTNISHDLRTPLTAICGYLDLLENEEVSETVKRYVSMIRNRTEALKALTEELFRYSVLVTVTEETKELLSVNQALEESLLTFYGAMKQKKIEPEISIPELRVERNLNRSALSRVFGNIISNAIKYSDGDLRVSLGEDGTVCFSNMASSLTSVEVGRLFDRFYTVETGRGGTGLGLSIAKLLTERMGGIIEAELKDQRLEIRVSFFA